MENFLLVTEILHIKKRSYNKASPSESRDSIKELLSGYISAGDKR